MNNEVPGLNYRRGSSVRKRQLKANRWEVTYDGRSAVKFATKKQMVNHISKMSFYRVVIRKLF